MKSFQPATQPAGLRPVRRVRCSRRWCFRLAAVMLGLSPFLVLELACRGLHLGQAELGPDPFVGFHAVRPLFVLDESGDAFHTSPARRGYFCEQRFPVQKPADEFRVFCLGGSTVYGRPYASETAFPAWLELNLSAADSQRTWRVINSGGVSYASYRLVPILEEVLDYGPDLIVICTGHNEFLEDRTYGDVKQTSEWLIAAERMAERSRLYNLIRGCVDRWRGLDSGRESAGMNVLPTEVDARLDYRGGLDAYSRDAIWQRQVIEHYRLNLHRMIELATRAGVPVILVDPVSNLRDCPPFKSEHREGFTAKDQERWDSLWEQAERSYSRDVPAALTALQAALEIDDQHAGLHYQLGQCYDALGEPENAERHYLLAKDHDICPLRMLESMHEVLRQVAAQTGTPLVEARRIIASRCRDGIADASWMTDHVHPSIRGHQQIADELAKVVVQQTRIVPAPDWLRRRDAAYAAHFDSLDNLYFLHGQRHLRVLDDWSRGRATLVRRHRSGIR